MAARVLVAVGLVAGGVVLGLPVLVALGILLGAVEVVHAIWSNRGIGTVRYGRRIDARRMSWGEEVRLDVEVWNRNPLPLAWLRADDQIEQGLDVRERAATLSESGGRLLVNTWTLAPFERVVRHLRLRADRRGVLGIGPAELAAGDLFAREAAHRVLPDKLLVTVWPRILPVGAVAPRERWGDVARARHGLFEDPSRFAGVRPYSPGDPLRRVHPRASARLRQPMTKTFEPSRERDLLIALDLQTGSGPLWDLGYDEDTLEGLFVVAASVAWSLAAEKAAFGLTAAGYTGMPRAFADVPIASAPGQSGRVLDVLARLSSTPSVGYEALLARIERRFSTGTTILALTARDLPPLVGPLRHLARAGFGIAVLTAGPDAVANARAARSAGFPANAAVLDGPWQSATRIGLA